MRERERELLAMVKFPSREGRTERKEAQKRDRGREIRKEGEEERSGECVGERKNL